MDIKYDVPAPPAGALERTISLGQRKMHSMRLAKMPLGRLLGLQLAHFSPLYWAVQFVIIVCIILSTGSGTESARFAVLVYAGAANALGCPELLRDISCSMSEIELSCRISGKAPCRPLTHHCLRRPFGADAHGCHCCKQVWCRAYTAADHGRCAAVLVKLLDAACASAAAVCAQPSGRTFAVARYIGSPRHRVPVGIVEYRRVGACVHCEPCTAGSSDLA